MPEFDTSLLAPLLAFLGILSLGLRFVLLSRLVPQADKASNLSDDVQIFDFESGHLVGASALAMSALSETDLADDAQVRLIKRLSEIFPEIESRMVQAASAEQVIELSKVIETGPVSVRLEQLDRNLRLRINGLAAPFADHKLVDRDAFDAQSAEIDTLRDITQVAPVPTWRETPLGEIDWINPAYEQLINRAALEGGASLSPFVRLFQSGSISKPGAEPRPRRSALKFRDGTSRIYEVHSIGHKDHSIHFAIDASATALAEDSLRNFAQTLTQTFAELPVGLAIFDAQRHLVMFNPSLMDLTSLKPEWLSARPTLYDVLNELREQRMIPERKDFRDWRDDLVHLERSAEKGTYLETWTLPSGQIYRVTGRPHPQGAIAMFFEDITSEIALTRKIRGEKKLQDDMLDAIDEAVVAFDSQGNLRASNSHFADMWGSDPCTDNDVCHVHDIVKLWQSQSHPSPVWGDLRDFVFQRNERAEWTGTIVHKDGRTLNLKVRPLSGLITMISFSEPDTEFAPISAPTMNISRVRAG